ncbi:MAG TPA: hypothetical protein VJH03_17505 [Blastocatellia bacterium]|nr:hypothetical protein [Blastocatellia bacterium]
MSKGSTWRIWDFHLHTPNSGLNNQFGDPESDETWKTYLGKVEAKARERGIAAIGFTDYLTIEGYKKVVAYKDRGGLDGIFVFPNVEFRVDKVIYRTRGGTVPKRLNFHVLFSPEISIRDIEEGFLHDLDFVYENEPFDPTKTRKLKVTNLVQFGELLRTHQREFESSPAFELAA